MESSIPCKITKDLTGSHLVRLDVNGQSFPLIVDDCFLYRDINGMNGDVFLKVFIVSSLTKQALVEIPSHSLGSSSRMWVPKEMLNGKTS